MKLPDFSHLKKLKNKYFSFFICHKIFFLAVVFISLITGSFIIWAVKVRNNFAAGLKSSQKTTTQSDYSITPDLTNLNINNLTASDSGILGTSDNGNSNNMTDNNSMLIPTPFPVFTLVPIPTYTPETVTTSNTSSTTTSTSCAGTPTAFNSEAIISSSSTVTNNPVTLTMELLDCNNNYGPVDDTLTLTLSSSDSSARINGSSSPVSVKVQNGKTTVSLNSQNAGTDIFIVHDVTRNFDITDPQNHNPSVTFTSNSTGNPSCTTGVGVPNSWYSDIYPASPVSANTGSSVTFTVNIRDCFKNNIPSNDSLSITLNSGDSGTQINGNNLPYTLMTQNGQGSFLVVSQNAGTDVFIVQDSTSSFPVTDTNNNNPSVVFSSANSNPTPIPTNTNSSQSPTPAPTTSITTVPSTPTPNPAPTSTPIPSPTSLPPTATPVSGPTGP